ncbi:MAG: hypothetical protein J6O61_12030 [Butyrivibrio sp.]|uniref:hypothetical protein n=1 Tax=Butyrivibrio sp. TaxID=28121 RepID=UPI001B083C6F|nr:hypothetical protein [Butyrivibrio sp.]MBO6241545.1 hypothetical protein [Butyrivibrio sp.]
MRNNTLTNAEYAFETIMWAVIAYLWYRYSLYAAIPGLRTTRSLGIFMTIIIAGTVMGYLLTVHWSRNAFSVAATAILPYGLYSFLAYRDSFKLFYLVVMILAAVLIVIYLIYVMRTRINRLFPSHVLELKMKKSLNYIRAVLGFASILLIIPIAINAAMGKKSKAFNYGEQYTIAKNIDTVLLLQDDNWKELSLPQRMDVLQCICHIEGNYLGLTKEIKIEIADLEENVSACYNNPDDMVYISKKEVESDCSSDALESVCHEMFHAAQFRYVEIYNTLSEQDKELYFFVDAADYNDEFMHYDDGSGKGGIMAYYGQSCEKDARDYAEVAVRDYFRRIAEYVEKDGV